MKTFKIALCVDGLWPLTIGGLEKHSFYMLKFLPSVGVSINLLHPYANESLAQVLSEHLSPETLAKIELTEVLEPKPVVGIPGHYIIDNYRYSKQVFYKLQEQKEPVDVIYAKGLVGWYLARHKKRSTLRSVPLVMNAHGYEMFQVAGSLKTFFSSAMLRIPFLDAMKRADYVVSYGGLITTMLLRLGFKHNRILEIPSGIDPEWLGQELDSPSVRPYKFVFLGRYERRKGVEELSSVLKSMGNEFSGEFHFIGPIPQAQRIQASWIHYHGQIKDLNRIKKLLWQCDVLVTPSHAEGMPNVIIEAMAARCAVIATDVGAVRLLVSPANGRLIQPRDQHALKNAIMELSELPPAEMNALKEHSHGLIREVYNWDRVARLTKAMLKEIAIPRTT